MARPSLRLLLCCALAGTMGCLHAQAKTPAPAPGLMTPEPPSPLVIPVTVDPPPAPAVTPDKPAPTPTPRPAGSRGAPPPTTPPPQTSAPPPDPTPTPVLQTGGSLAELEAEARELLDRAEKNLARVKRDSLGRDAQVQYDSAALYIKLARQGISTKNFPYAKACADKATTLAALLVK